MVKVFVHWMANFASLFLNPLVTTIPLKPLVLTLVVKNLKVKLLARVMTDHELLISLHQKVDRNHEWVQRQIHQILHYMTVTQNLVKKNHYYTHETFDHAWAILSHPKIDEELKELGFQQDFDWSHPP